MSDHGLPLSTVTFTSEYTVAQKTEFKIGI